MRTTRVPSLLAALALVVLFAVGVAGCIGGPIDGEDVDFNEEEVKILDLRECCGADFSLCDGRPNSCRACGGTVSTGGICIPTRSPEIQ